MAMIRVVNSLPDLMGKSRWIRDSVEFIANLPPTTLPSLCSVRTAVVRLPVNQAPRDASDNDERNRSHRALKRQP